MPSEINPYDQSICTIAATLTVASLGSEGLSDAATTVQRYREILSELANTGGLQRGAPPRERPRTLGSAFAPGRSAR